MFVRKNLAKKTRHDRRKSETGGEEVAHRAAGAVRICKVSDRVKAWRDLAALRLEPGSYLGGGSACVARR